MSRARNKRHADQDDVVTIETAGLAQVGRPSVVRTSDRMRRPPADAEAVLITGVYGAGKSTVVADIGGMLERRGEYYGVLDVDWLGWFDAGGGGERHQRVLLSNVRTLCGAYLSEGVRRLALAYAIRDRVQLDALRGAVTVPMRVVRLEVSADLIEKRLSADPTEERRQDDLRVAREWLSAGLGAGLEDLVLPGDQPVRRTSEAICSWLGWI